MAKIERIERRGYGVYLFSDDGRWWYLALFSNDDDERNGAQIALRGLLEINSIKRCINLTELVGLTYVEIRF